MVLRMTNRYAGGKLYTNPQVLKNRHWVALHSRGTIVRMNFPFTLQCRCTARIFIMWEESFELLTPIKVFPFTNYRSKRQLGLRIMSKSIVIFIVTYFLGILKYTLLFLGTYGLIRAFACGLHANKSSVCMIISLIIFIIIPFFGAYFKPFLPPGYGGITIFF